MKQRACIAGVGYTEQGRVPGRTYLGFALDAAQAALNDAGLTPKDIDGVMTQISGDVFPGQITQGLGIEPGFEGIGLPWGNGAMTLLHQAVHAIESGMAQTILIAYGNSHLSNPHGGAAPGKNMADPIAGVYGMFGAPASYALVARAHMNAYGTTEEHLGHIAISTREWALKNPIATMRDRPLTMDDYLDGRFIAEPFRIYDCCLVSDGGRAIIVTTEERAKSMRRKPVYISGMGQGHWPGDLLNRDDLTTSPAKIAAPKALAQAGLSLDDVDVTEFYDCFTITTLITIEDYGFCAKGEGGAYAAEGRLAPGGTTPTNTSGGLLSEAYLHGWTSLTEGVRQVRGDAGGGQIPGCRVALVGGNGGIIQHHLTAVLTDAPSN